MTSGFLYKPWVAVCSVSDHERSIIFVKFFFYFDFDEHDQVVAEYTIFVYLVKLLKLFYERWNVRLY